MSESFSFDLGHQIKALISRLSPRNSATRLAFHAQFLKYYTPSTQMHRFRATKNPNHPIRREPPTSHKPQSLPLKPTNSSSQPFTLPLLQVLAPTSSSKSQLQLTTYSTNLFSPSPSDHLLFDSWRSNQDRAWLLRPAREGIIDLVRKG